MQKTHAKALRARLKEFLDLAAKQPLRIQRRSSDSLILMNENHYNELKNELLILQRKLLNLPSLLSEKRKKYKVRYLDKKMKEKKIRKK